MPTSSEAQRAAIRELSVDPLYQLSTAGQELFHTNILYWLAVHRPAQSSPVWDLLGVDAPVEGAPDPRGEIRREWHHIDLAIDSGMPGRKLILENKVLALATATQLNKYYSRISTIKPYTTPETSWRILRLLPLRFEPPQPWGAITYDALVPALHTTASNLGGDDRVLVNMYAYMVRKLVTITECFDPAEVPDTPMFLDTTITRELRDSRSLALVRKLQMSRCADILNRRLAALLPADLIEIEVGMTNTQGLLALVLPGEHGRRFGWQVQGNQLRFVVIIGDGDKQARSDREQMVEAEHLDYYENANPPSSLAHIVGAYSGTKRWQSYEPDFVYRYRKLSPSTTWDEFIEIVVWATEYAYEYVTSSS